MTIFSLGLPNRLPTNEEDAPEVLKLKFGRNNQFEPLVLITLQFTPSVIESAIIGLRVRKILIFAFEKKQGKQAFSFNSG
jgi:hypothetical protein